MFAVLRSAARPWHALPLAIAILAIFSAPTIWQSIMVAGASPLSAGAADDPSFRLLGFCCLTMALFALSSRLKWAFCIVAFFAFLAPLELFYLSQYGLPSGSHVYGVIADSDTAEAMSWLGPWLIPLVVGMALHLVFVLVAARACWRADWRWNHRSRIWVLAAFTVLATALVAKEAWLAQLSHSADNAASNPYLQQSLTQSGDSIAGQIEASFPWGLPQRFWHFADHERALAAHMDVARHHDFGVRWPAGQPAAGRQIHVLVIGETGRPDRWALFGAARATTPQLSARAGLVGFGNAVSGASATREAVPLMLTRRPAGHELAPTDEPSVVTAFKQAGFKTYWLSTQGSAGAHETPISVLAREADEQHFINGADYRGAGALDGDLLPLLRTILARPEARQLIVLHTLGSHLNYAHRYPKAFERFTPALQRTDQPNIWQNTQAELMRNAYDNSVLYTDRVLDAAITMLQEKSVSSTLSYAADHGETLFDGKCGRAGHGFAAEVNYRVPMFVWASAAWQQAHLAAWKDLQVNSHKAVSTMSMSSTLMGLAGFTVAVPSTYPDLSKPFTAMPPRLITHFGDFDKNLVGRSCDSPVVR